MANNSASVVIILTTLVKITESGLSFFYFLSHFYFLFDLFSICLFLELRVRFSDNITWSHISHKSQVTQKDVEGSRKDNIIQHMQHMLTLRITHGCLGQVRSNQHGPCGFSIQDRLSCTEFSIEFSYVNLIQDSFF